MANDYSLSEESFRGCSAEETRDNHLSYLTTVVLGEIVSRFQHPSDPSIHAHLQGCAQRLQIMEHARLAIAEASRNSNSPIGVFTVTHLNMCLNAYYVNLRGGLDNLAWAATYEFSLLAQIDETDRDTRFFCTPTSLRFNKALALANAAASAQVAAIGEWLQELATFRDPAAHRLPLSMPPALLTFEEGKRYDELHMIAAQAIADGRWDDYDALMTEANALGRFVPLLNTPRTAGGGLFVVPNQIAADHRKFLDFVHGFLAFFKSANPAHESF